MTTHRPSPDELLRLAESQDGNRGRLKIFLGYAPRVGKSLRMFDEGVRRKRRGQDVVVGAIQPRGASEVADKIAELEVIGSGGDLDVQRILKRKPQVCLVDELAVDNPTGSKNPKRWQDVQNLLDSGINVITALNLQHIEEQQDAVERITGKRTVNSVPETFIRNADEIVVVDMPTTQHSELRERSLCLAAEVIEAQLQRYMDLHGIHQSWGTQERILVCVTPRSNAKVMIESGRRNADRFHGHLFAVHVTQSNVKPEDQPALDANLDLARKLGAEVHLICGRDPIAEIIRFARHHRITQIFIGHTQQKGWRPWARSPVDRLIQMSEGIDVRIFPQS
jgi:two-component system sensor histidine kinase KdpD